MPSLARLQRTLLLVLVTAGLLVPGGLSMRVCLCPARASEPASPAPMKDCGMPCCRAAERDQGPAAAPASEQQQDCTGCRVLRTGERQPTTLAGAGIDVPHAPAAVLPVCALFVAPALGLSRCRPAFGGNLAPPRRPSQLPLRI